MRRAFSWLVPAVILIASWAAWAGSAASGETWAERLGYGPKSRVLILHADDVGMCCEANLAAEEYFRTGDIQSASIMVPCPWFNDFAAWYKEHPEADCGVHVTLNSEWKHYRWGPVAPRGKVPGLVDKDGMLYSNVLQTALGATREQVETEIRAQIERALASGIKPTHLDTHMGAVYCRPDVAQVFLKLALEYKIPAFAIEPTPEMIEKLRREGFPATEEMIRALREYPMPKLDRFTDVPRGKSYEEVRAKFFDLVRSLPPGITQIIFHPSVESEALKRITGSWRQRTWEARLFADPEVKQFFKDQGVEFTTWREMGRRYRQRQGKDAAGAKGG
ncbi:MAG: polysaccharide deacetylase family protein [Planctomycetia bacterium]|nr:polysaccharide deacetylase family protein [Planctomycetia bacterium]